MKRSTFLAVGLALLCFFTTLTTTAVAQMSGDYVIGSGRDYTLLGDAIAALNSVGALGTVRFLINEDLSEAGSPSITSTTLNGTNTLVIKPNTGKTPTVTFSGCVATGNNAYSGLTIDGVAAAVGYVTIDGSNTPDGTSRDLTIKLSDGTAGRYCINAVGNADYVIVRNCKFLFDALMDQSVSANRGAAVRTNGTAVATANDNITIQNNEIGTGTQAAGYGILISNAASTFSSNVSILDNVVYGSTVPINTLRANTGISSSLNINGNTVSLVGFDTPLGYSEYGIWVDNSSSTVNIKNNKIVKVNGYNSNAAAFPLYGIFLGRQSAGSTVNVVNNFVSNFNWHGTNKTLSNIFGIHLAGATASTYNIYYNSVYLNGDNLDGNTSSLIVFNVVNALSTVNLKNNIFVNTADISTAYTVSSPATAVLTSNYNDLYVSGTNANVGSYSAVAQKTLANWQTASSQDANSNSFSPDFTSVTELHLNVSSVNHNYDGTAIGGYNTDIDGQLRDPAAPYKGADEVITYPLPIQLASFTATYQTNGVRLDWRTLSETNNYGFEIQRSAEQASGFASLPNSFVAGHGTTNQPHDYSFTDNSVQAGSWYYRLKQIDLDGTIHFTEPINVSSPTSVKETAPAEFALTQNYPNPFNPTTVVGYQLPAASDVKLVVYDILGREVAMLVNERKNAGTYTVQFDGLGLSSGVYLYVLTAGGSRVSRQMTLEH